MAREEYALSARTTSGRVRGLPRRRGTRKRAITSVTAGASPACPAVKTNARSRHILAGTGYRTDLRSHAEAQEFFGLPVTGLTLVNPDYYHLDTALAVLSDTEIMYYPAAFSPGSEAVLRTLFPDAVRARPEDAAAFGLNAFSDGYNVVLPQTATHLMARLKNLGFNPIGVDLSELLKAGGSVKCCTLKLR